jgi:hypothetical protein
MKRALLAIMVGALYVLHQDFWFWRSATPLVFGFLPIGLFYHACYSVAVAAAVWLLVKYAWPSHLDENPGDEDVPGVAFTRASSRSNSGEILPQQPETVLPEGEH